MNPTPPAPGQLPAALKTPVATPGLPAGQPELATLAEAAAKAWAASPLPALLWCPKAQLADLATAYRGSLGAADAAGDTLSPTAQRLRELDRETRASLKFVKRYLAEAHGEEGARAYYDEFGIPGGSFATARPRRATQLAKLLLALKAHKFDQNKYGTAYWQPLATEYAALAGESSATRQSTSGEVGLKNSQEKPLRKVLRALRLSIRANFPDTFEAELREFGFLAESY